MVAAATAAGPGPFPVRPLDKVDLQEGSDGKFNAQFDVAPQVPLPGYKGLDMVKKKQVIDDEATSSLTFSAGAPRASATRPIWKRAPSGLMWGSRPLAEVNTRSAGTGASAGSLCAWRSAFRAFATLV